MYLQQPLMGHLMADGPIWAVENEIWHRTRHLCRSLISQGILVLFQGSLFQGRNYTLTVPLSGCEAEVPCAEV